MLLVPKTLSLMQNIHLEHISAFFSAGTSIVEVNPDVKFLFLCFTNRCGSNLLAEFLASTNLINTAGEFFNAGTIIDNCRDNKLSSLADYINFLISKRSGRGLLASKISIEQLIAMTEFGVLDSILSRTAFVFLERSDKLSQAISLDLAYQTGQWSTKQGVLNQDLTFDAGRISTMISYIIDQNRAFDMFFTSNGIVPARLTYEALVRHPQHHVNEITELLTLAPGRIDLSRLSLRQQANRWNREWRQRYLASNDRI